MGYHYRESGYGGCDFLRINQDGNSQLLVSEMKVRVYF